MTELEVRRALEASEIRNATLEGTLRTIVSAMLGGRDLPAGYLVDPSLVVREITRLMNLIMVKSARVAELEAQVQRLEGGP